MCITFKLFFLNREAALNEKDEQIEKLRDELHELVERSISPGPDECDSMKKTLDVFISYRRSNGSQLASLLKVYLESRQFSVFLDIDRYLFKNYKILLYPKGQITSKANYGILNSSKKRTNKFDFTTMIPQVDLFTFVFWRKLKTPKRHFEVN